METETISQNPESLTRKASLKPRSKQKIWRVWHLYLVPVGVVTLVAIFSMMEVLIPPLPKMLFFLAAVAVTLVILLWSGGMVFRAYSHQSNGSEVASANRSIGRKLLAYYGIILLIVSVVFFSGYFITSKFPDKDKLSERTKYMEKFFQYDLTD